jgi:hypothetical protein
MIKIALTRVAVSALLYFVSEQANFSHDKTIVRAFGCDDFGRTGGSSGAKRF